MTSASRDHLNRAMRRLADGDRAAFDTVFAAVVPTVRRVAAAMLRATPSDVDDAVQLAMTKLFTEAADFRPDGDVMRWAIALVGWECRTLRQRRVRQKLSDSEPGKLIGTIAPGPEETAIANELHTSLHELLGALSDDDRALVTRTVVGASPAVRKRRQRLIERLRAMWRSYHGPI